MLLVYLDIFTIISEPSGSAHFAVPLQEEYHPMERDEDVRLYVKVALYDHDHDGPQESENLGSCKIIHGKFLLKIMVMI
jgi:hypothetical protein